MAASHLLTPNIPFAGSLVFRPEDSDTACRVHAGFTPQWYRQHLALDFGQRWHADVHCRHATFVDMADCLNRQFPRLRLGGDSAKIAGTISQVQTCAFIGSLFGLHIRYFEDNWPANEGAQLTDEAADSLVPPDFWDHPVFLDLLSQMDVIEKEWGTIGGDLNYQGVLNTAFRLRGERIFTDMVEHPARAHRVLDAVADTMIAVIDAVHARQGRSGVRKDFFCTANCVVNMISAEMYREFVMPYDRKLSDHFPRFGIHNCAWRVDPYAEAYAQIRTLAYLDFGLDSNLARLRDLFPDTTLAAMYSPVALREKPLEAIRGDLQRLHDDIGRCRIILADVEAGTPDKRVEAFFGLAAEIWGLPVEELAAIPEN